MMTENFVDIPGYEGLYQVSENGFIKSCVKSKGTSYKQRMNSIIKKSTLDRGYLQTSLSKMSCKKTIRIHRIVAQTFIPNHDNLPEVNHKDGNKLNNNVSNLEWCTRLENERHSWAIGLKNMRGGNHFASRKVTQFDLNMTPIRDWVNSLAVEKALGFHATHIRKCCNGKLNTAYGFIWKRIWD